jgi:hypothetical protein
MTDSWGAPVRVWIAVFAVFAVVLACAGIAEAKAPVKCKSADLRYPFMPGGPKDFGVFKLRITGGSCATAHRVAKTWMKRFEAAISAGHVKLPHSVNGFTFKTLNAHMAQTYSERGRKPGATLWFDYRVPNG